MRAALEAMPSLASIDPARIAVLGASYTGESMAQAARDMGSYQTAYVALSPGNFSEESIAAIDASGAPWLFVRAEIELPFFPALFEAIRDGSETAEIWVLPGKGHATDLFDQNPDLPLRLLAWIDEQLAKVPR